MEVAAVIQMAKPESEPEPKKRAKRGEGGIFRPSTGDSLLCASEIKPSSGRVRDSGTGTENNARHISAGKSMVPERGLEPPRPCDH